MEAIGELIIGLHRNLEEIRASLDTTGAAHNTQQGILLQSTIDRAEVALRKQARDLCSAAQGNGVAVGPTHGFGRLPSPGPGGQQAARRTAPPGVPVVPPQRSRSPAPPTTGCDARAGSADLARHRPLRAPAHGSRTRAKTSGAQRLLPKPNRLDPLADPPAITERDLEGGLYSLATRGFIPSSADLTPAMERGVPVMQQRPAPLYDQALRRERREIAPADDLLAVRLDPNGSARQRGASEEPSARGARQLPPLKPPPLSPAASLKALPAPPVDIEPAAAPAAPAASVAQSYGTFCTELLEAAPDEALVPITRGPSEAEIRTAAATRIAAAWRGCKQRRIFQILLRAHQAARQIQSAWVAAMTRMATKMQLSRMQEEERKQHTRLMYELGQDWFQTKQHRRIEIHICSLTLAEGRKRRMDGFQELQASQIARIFRLMDPRRDIIFVAPRQLHEDILEYYSKIMQFRGVKNPPGRFQVVVPEQMDINHRLSLTQALLCSPKALKRLRKLTNGRQAYVIPGMVTPAELKLCGQLKLPLLGAGPRNMVLLSSKSNGKKLAQLAELPTGPWAVDIYDEDEFFTSLAGLVVKHPQVRTWLFKIDDERASRGHAFIDLWKLREVSDSIRTTAQATSMSSDALALRSNADEPAVLGADANEVRQLLRKHVPKKAVLCNRGAYPDFAAWMAEASRVGAVIQAVPDEIVSQTSVHLQIEPDGSTTVLGTSEAIMGNPFVRVASWFPHTRGSWEVLHEVGIRMGRTLAAKGLMGFASVDVVFFENPGFDPEILAQEEREPTPQVIGGSETPVDQQHLMFRDLRSPSPELSSTAEDGRGRTPGAAPSLSSSRQADYDLAMQLQSLQSGVTSLDPVSLMLGASPQVGASPASRYGCWVVDVDARLTEEASALFPLQFIAQVKMDPHSGTFRVTGEAAALQQSAQQEDSDQHLTEEQRGERLNRWAIASAAATAPGLEKMSYQTLFQAAKMRGVSFDLFHNIGCVFTFLDVFHSLFSFLAVEKTPEHCVKRLASAAGTLTEGAAGQQPLQQRGQPGRSGDTADGLSAGDLQMALRMLQRKMADKGAK